MINIDTLKPCTWDEIEVGEIYYSPSGFVSNKINKTEGLIINDVKLSSFDATGLTIFWIDDNDIFYKLPLSIQRLFIGKGDYMKPTTFKDLKIGDCFTANSIFSCFLRIKTSNSTSIIIHDFEYYICNYVGIEDCFFVADDKVKPCDNVTKLIWGEE